MWTRRKTHKLCLALLASRVCKLLASYLSGRELGGMRQLININNFVNAQLFVCAIGVPPRQTRDGHARIGVGMVCPGIPPWSTLVHFVPTHIPVHYVCRQQATGIISSLSVCPSLIRAVRQCAEVSFRKRDLENVCCCSDAPRRREENVARFVSNKMFWMLIRQHAKASTASRLARGIVSVSQSCQVPHGTATNVFTTVHGGSTCLIGIHNKTSLGLVSAIGNTHLGMSTMSSATPKPSMSTILYKVPSSYTYNLSD